MAHDREPEGLATFRAALPALRGPLHRYLARMAGSVIDGEDILQDALIAAATALQAGAQVDNLRAWLFRIAHNTALNHFRAAKREAAMKEHLIHLPPMPQPAPWSALPEALTPYLALSPTQRSMVILRDVLGYSAAEVAALTDTSISAVKSALRRGRVALRAARDDDEAATASTVLSTAQTEMLRRYAALFNAHDFDALRDMLSNEVRLELVAVEKRQGKARVSGYFSNYAKREDWHMVPGQIEGRPALLSVDRADPDGAPRYFILLDADAAGVQAIRDFRYARYAMGDARWLRI